MLSSGRLFAVRDAPYPKRLQGEGAEAIYRVSGRFLPVGKQSVAAAASGPAPVKTAGWAHDVCCPDATTADPAALRPCAGRWTCLVAVLRLAGGALPLSYGLWVALSGAVGAWAGLAVSWEDFGWPGFRGAFRAILGGIKFSLIAAIAGGTMVLPVFGTMFAPLAVCITLLAVPAAAVGLLATLALTHRAVRRWRSLAGPAL